MRKELGLTRISFNQGATSITCNSTMILNNFQIGHSGTPAEIVLEILPSNTLFKVKIHYDKGSQHSLRNEAIAPLVISKKFSIYTIQLTTIQGSSNEIREIVTVNLAGRTFEVILVKGLSITTYPMVIPEE